MKQVQRPSSVLEFVVTAVTYHRALYKPSFIFGFLSQNVFEVNETIKLRFLYFVIHSPRG